MTKINKTESILLERIWKVSKYSRCGKVFVRMNAGKEKTA
jgi:hypothetical protein